MQLMPLALVLELLLLSPIPSSPATLDPEHRCLIENVYYESRGEPLSGQIAVAQVTLNRVRSKRYPNTICEVVHQPYQFSWTLNKKRKKPDPRSQSWINSARVAFSVLDGYVKEDYSKGAIYFFNPRVVKPRWARTKLVVAEYGGHRFLR